jgi:hypothetical protein
MDMRRTRTDRWVAGTALVLAIVFFWASFRAPDKWSDLALGMATSFVFILLVEGILWLRAHLAVRQLRRFFGDDLVRTQIRLNCPDFVLHEEAASLLREHGQGVVFQRPTLAGTPHHPEPMHFATALAYLDVVGLMAVATKLGGLQTEPTRLVTDTEDLGDTRHSFIAAGLTSNHVTMRYLETDPEPLFRFATRVDDVPILTLAKGPMLSDSPTAHHAVILRFTPDRRNGGQRRWFIIAGLQEHGTAAAGSYLASQWTTLARATAADEDFVAVVRFPPGLWHDADLVHLVTRAPGGEPRTRQVTGAALAGH